MDTRGGYMPGVEYNGYKWWIYATGIIYWILGVDICLGYSIIDTRCRGMPQVSIMDTRGGYMPGVEFNGY